MLQSYFTSDCLCFFKGVCCVFFAFTRQLRDTTADAVKFAVQTMPAPTVVYVLVGYKGSIHVVSATAATASTADSAEVVPVPRLVEPTPSAVAQSSLEDDMTATTFLVNSMCL